MFSIVFLIVWILGTIASFAFCSFMKGMSKKRYEADPTILDMPPWTIGQLTSWLWPFQAAVYGFLSLKEYAEALGSGVGIERNKELKELRETQRKVNEQHNLTMQILTDKHIDPDDLDTQTLRMLNTAAIRIAMEDDSAQKAIERADRREEMVVDILDAAGHKVRDPLDLTPSLLKKPKNPEPDLYITNYV